jgi:hypothetical protein
MLFRLSLLILFILVSAAYSALSTNKQKQFVGERFTKVLHSGALLDPHDGPWHCVLDKQEKLLWEVKTDDESIHDGYWTYSWFDEVIGVENRGDCYFEKSRCDTDDLIRATNQQELCGQKNWRLPNKKELQSLLLKNTLTGFAKIDSSYFPQLKNGDYWAANNQRPLSKKFRKYRFGASSLNFFSGNTTALPYKNAAFVILVTDTRRDHH